MKKIFSVFVLLSLLTLLLNAQSALVQVNSLQEIILKDTISPRKAATGKIVPNLSELPPRISSREVVLFEGFESTTGFNLPTGWTKVGGNGATGWRTISNTESVAGVEDLTPVYSGTRVLSRSWQHAGTGNWVFSNGLSLTGGTTYVVSFYFVAPGYIQYNEYDNFEVRIGQTATAAGMASSPIIYSHNNRRTDYQIFEYASTTFTPPNSGTYYLTFHCTTPAGEGFYILIDDVWMGEEGPGEHLPPQNLSASGGHLEVNLVWEAPEDVGDTLTGYKIFRNGIAIASINYDLITYKDFPISNNITNSYYVTAVYTAPPGESVPSNTASGTPVGPDFINNSPRNLMATNSSNTVNLTWDQPNTHNGILAGYQVYRNGSKLTITFDATSFKDYPLVNGLEYSYQVVAVYSFPNVVSEPTETVIGNPIGTTIAPGPPTNLTGMALPGEVTLRWDLPSFSEQGTTITYATSTDFVDAYGLNSQDWDYTVLHRYTTTQFTSLGVMGKKITKISYYVNSLEVSYGIMAMSWTGDNYTIIRDEQSLVVPTSEGWFDFYFNEPILIGNQDLSIGVRMRGGNADDFGYPLSLDAGPVVLSYGTQLYIATSSYLYTDGFEDQDGNWMIRGFATDVPGSTIEIALDTTAGAEKRTNLVHQSLNIPVISSPYHPQTLSSSRNFIGYLIYRDDALITPDLIHSLIFTDTNIPVVGASSTFTYKVTANYENSLESSPISVSLTVPAITTVSVPYEEGFNSSSFPPTGWTRVQNGGTESQWITLTAQPYEGPRCASSSSGTSALAYFPDNWLISPQIDIPYQSTRDDLYLTYFVGCTSSSNFAEKYSVLISTSGIGMSSDNYEVVFTETLSTNEWVPRQIPLNDYAGQKIFIAFRHHDSSIQATRSLKLDAVSISDATADFDPAVDKLETSLLGNYPNPFNPETIISYSMAKEGFVELDVFNIKGQKVKTLVNGLVSAGMKEVVWNGTDQNNQPVSSGVYFYKLNTESVTSVKRMILLK